jgi:hypothetical protein
MSEDPDKTLDMILNSTGFGLPQDLASRSREEDLTTDRFVWEEQEVDLRERGPAPQTHLLLAPSFQPSHLLVILPKHLLPSYHTILLIIANTDTDLLIV